QHAARQHASQGGALHEWILVRLAKHPRDHRGSGGNRNSKEYLQLTWQALLLHSYFCILNFLLRSSEAAGLERPVVEPMQISHHGGSDQPVMMDGKQVFGDKPQWLISSHPVAMVEASEIYRTRECPQRALAPQIEIPVEVAHRQLAQRTIYWLAISAAGVIGFCNRAPVAVSAINRDHMIRVLIRFEIEDQRRISVRPQGSRCQQGAFKTVSAVLAQHAPW